MYIYIYLKKNIPALAYLSTSFTSSSVDLPFNCPNKISAVMRCNEKLAALEPSCPSKTP